MVTFVSGRFTIEQFKKHVSREYDQACSQAEASIHAGPDLKNTHLFAVWYLPSFQYHRSMQVRAVVFSGGRDLGCD